MELTESQLEDLKDNYLELVGDSRSTEACSSAPTRWAAARTVPGTPRLSSSRVNVQPNRLHPVRGARSLSRTLNLASRA